MTQASMTVHLMLFYELKQLETMLDSTNDMIGDMCNATSADVIQFASSHTYEQFLQRTSELSALDSFPILRSRVGQVGAELLKVVYRGYSATPQLQEMHDEAIIRRTQIRLDSDQAREEQEKRAMELRCRQERSVQEQQVCQMPVPIFLLFLFEQEQQVRYTTLSSSAGAHLCLRGHTRDARSERVRS
ncbi:hypothetical protein T492DRAFT_439388 [Pavlovales sp. CCMP2436]|nr:hypothetical protein T492DRAFT_439388 [Pavlovales sp. CCMP2436]